MRIRVLASFLSAALVLVPGVDPSAFTLHAAAGDDVTGPPERVGPDWSVTVARKSVAGADLIALRRPELPLPAPPHDRPHALFTNGDRLPGTVVAVGNDRVEFAAEFGDGAPQTLSVPLPALAAVWLTDRAARDAAEPEGRRWLAEKRPHDVVLLGNRDTLTGSVVGLAEGGPLRIDAGGQESAVPRDRVRGIAFNTELARTLKPRGPFARLVLRNGARLGLASATLDAGRGELVGRTLFAGKAEPPVRVPLGQVMALNILGGRAVYLSDLTPRRYQHTPYLGVSWPYQADRSVTGGDLRLGGSTYDKGLGVHSRCELVYAVPKGAKRFEALVGLDAGAGPRGSVRVQVLADGKPLVAPVPELNAADAPQELRLPLPAGVKELTLLVEFGRGGDVQDHVDWADARFVTGG